MAEVRPGVRCPTGEARITPGGDLPARFVIHTGGSAGCAGTRLTHFLGVPPGSTSQPIGRGQLLWTAVLLHCPVRCQGSTQQPIGRGQLLCTVVLLYCPVYCSVRRQESREALGGAKAIFALLYCPVYCSVCCQGAS